MVSKCFGLFVASGLVAHAPASGVDLETDGLSESLLAQDNECDAQDCALNALQLRAAAQKADPEAVDSGAKEGEEEEEEEEETTDQGADLISLARDRVDAGWADGWNYTLYNDTDGVARDGVEPPTSPGQYNGMSWPTMNVDAEVGAESHFLAIGDWGGMDGEMNPLPDGFARMVMYPGSDEHGPHVFPRSRQGCDMQSLIKCFARHGHCKSSCGYADGIDDQAQILVANQMKRRASMNKPKAILNVGDNFYWGGIAKRCGYPMDKVHPVTKHQFDSIFEDVYSGSLLGVPWLSVLGNHDWGGREFTAGWDQQIAYTWASDRWLMPAIYWHQRMQFPDYAADFFMLDTNINDAMPGNKKPDHNVCSYYNIKDASCTAAGGPSSVETCPQWFQNLWNEQEKWVENMLSKSTADWQIIVTHFPCEKHPKYWRKLHDHFGLDLLVTGHKHDQELWKAHDASTMNKLGGLTCFVTGGGGGITSEDSPIKYKGIPHAWPNVDTQYGFFDLAMSKKTIRVESIDINGEIVDSTTVHPKSIS